VYLTTRGIIEDLSPLLNRPLVGRPNLFAGRSPISSKPHHRFFGFDLEVPASQRVLLSAFFPTFFLFSSFDLRKKEKKRKRGTLLLLLSPLSYQPLPPPRPTFGKRKKRKKKKKVRMQKYQTNSVSPSCLPFPLLPHYYHTATAATTYRTQPPYNLPQKKPPEPRINKKKGREERMANTLDKVAEETVRSLEIRLRRIEFVLSGTSEDPISDLFALRTAGRENSVHARLAALEYDLAKLCRKSTTVKEMINICQSPPYPTPPIIDKRG